MSLFGRKNHIGLDIGNHNIQLAAVEEGKARALVWGVPTCPKRVDKDDISQRSEIIERVKLALGPYQSYVERAGGEAALAIQGKSVITGYLPLPKLDENEQQLAVRSTITREVPFPVGALEIVHIPVKPLAGEKAAVFYSSWKKSESDELWAVAKACGLEVTRVEASGVALTRGLYRNRALDPESFYAIVDIGFDLTQIVLVKGGYPYYIRDVALGGKDITHAIQVGTQVSWEEAESIKRSLPLFEIIHTVNPILVEIEYEISRSLEYCLRHLPCDSISSIYLSGGTALLSDFPEWLEEELHIPVTREDWDQVTVVKSEGQALQKVAVGLALG